MNHEKKGSTAKDMLWSLPSLVFFASLAAASGVLLGKSWLAFIGAIGALGGAFWSSRQEATYEEHLREKSDEIADLNREIVGLVTGGDSFCYMAVSSINPAKNIGLLVFVQEGKDPLYGVEARIVDLQKFEQIKNNLTFTTLTQAQRRITIGDMAAEAATMTEPIDLGDGTQKDYNIFFNARNGFFNQGLHLRKIGDSWLQRSEVTRNGQVIYEKADDGYPGDDQ